MSTRGKEAGRGEGAQAGDFSPGASDDARSSSLDPTAEELEALAQTFQRLTLEYLSRPSSLPVFPETSGEQVAELFRRPLPVEGAGLEALARDCERVISHSRQNGHPRMFGYVASPAAPAAVFAALLGAALNSNVTSWRSAPGPTAVEQTVVGWLAEMIGYKASGVNETCGGLLTSGGSMANLNALFVAHRTRARRLTAETDNTDARVGTGETDDGREPSRAGLWNAGVPMTVYASDQVHLSIPKAADLLGLGREQVRVVPSDEGFGVDVRALRERIEADARAGLRPFCVVANAGTVSTGAVDPLREVARVAREHGLWLHVDGAYGALAASAESKRALFDGLEEADSVSLDPHKWLYTPLGCGCLLFREPAHARAAFAGTEEGYIKVFESEEEEAFAFWDYGTELSRPFRALKVWALLNYYGARRVGEAIADDCALAEYMAERVRASEEFELMAPVVLGICCFRYVPEAARRGLEAAEDDEERERLNVTLDELNARVMRRVQRGGEAYLSNAVLRGRFALRASITNFRTTRRDIDLTLDVVRRAAREVERE
ncbi:MAG TPA: aminotransferase class I/II-fold pyridoxal phosphate-dependent enzyme [Pyrinomonadaceae bacterium]|nr:aminotransferase class I/II-fold pyridoxal phosphate-dependent enzyme [Pyrinomonadaceae bacterium]